MTVTPIRSSAVYAAESATEVLRWQASQRVAIAAVASALAALAVLSGWASPSRATWGGADERSTVTLLVASMISYVLTVVALTRRAQPAQLTRRPALQSFADMAMICLIAVLTCEPDNYERMLMGGMLLLPIIFLYFGVEATYIALSTLVGGFLGATAMAMRAGATHLVWSDVLPPLGIMVIGSVGLIAVYGRFHFRLHQLATLFDRAQAGELDAIYDVSADRRPDVVTVVGRAYNRLRDQVVSAVLTDPLSGCLNRRGFTQEHHRVIALAARSRASVSLLAVDLDHFKQVNDLYGHLEGDAVIAQVGELLREKVRTSDVVARIGGEEFLMLLPETDGDGAVQLAQRVREAFHRRRFGRDASVSVTTSIGVASQTIDGAARAEELRARADEALYAAKKAGRDRVIAWSTVEESSRSA
jgi:diguanylate cyclase (GGDEF)-like protein